MNAIDRIGGLAGAAGAPAAGVYAGPGSVGPAGPLGPFGPDSPAGDGASGGQSFVDALGDAIRRLNDQLASADGAAADFAAGGAADLHTVMLEMQEAAIGLRVGIAVRDRLLEAYQEIMRLQV